ncbi:hypothetical protein [Corynebacterium timonense]|uniref:Uncharacterized protein n=1 Tax=Corynebacterium timonense TaxID=441500 RepID=A0A1H1L2E3_9CORY|nr:hypothetical protein [Corynebacterium timonense]SDR68741.1 hypothetical protein SAMN04488539_0034 [Corynebacterium timonense]
MDLGTIATQLGDFKKIAAGFVDFAQNLPKLFERIGDWIKPNTLASDTSSALFGINRSETPLPKQDS